MTAPAPFLASHAALSNEERLQKLLAIAPRPVLRRYRQWVAAIDAVNAAPKSQKLKTARIWARRLGVSVKTVISKRSQAKRDGQIVLIDKTWNDAAWQRKQPFTPAPAHQPKVRRFLVIPVLWNGKHGTPFQREKIA